MDTDDTNETARGVVYIPAGDGGHRLVLIMKKDLYNFPGGRIKRGETPEQAFLRELREETGLTLRGRPIYCGMRRFRDVPCHMFGAYAFDPSGLRRRGTFGEKVLIATDELYGELVEKERFTPENDRIFDGVYEEAVRRSQAQSQAA